MLNVEWWRGGGVEHAAEALGRRTGARAAARPQRLRARALPRRLARRGLPDVCVAHLELPLLELLVSDLHKRGPVDALDDKGVRVVVLGAL